MVPGRVLALSGRHVIILCSNWTRTSAALTEKAPLRFLGLFNCDHGRNSLLCLKDHHSEWMWYMPPEPAPAGPGRDESRPGKPPAPGQPARPEPGNALSGGTTPWPAWEPVITRPDWMTEEDLARLDSLTEADEPWWLEEGDPDPEEDASPDDRDFAEIAAGCRQATEDRARAAAVAARLGTTGALGAIAASSGRRGPDQPGSAQVFPGEDSGPAAQFATGLLLDTMPGRPELARFADAAAGPDDAFNGASDDELLGVLCAWERLESHAAARKHAAVAELIRPRPARDCAAEGPARMPRAWDEFTAAELCAVLARSRYDADQMLGLAHDLEVKLPGTRAAFLDGIIGQEKAEIIARATAVLDAREARAAEDLVLDRAGRLTPGGLRSAVARSSRSPPRRPKSAASRRPVRPGWNGGPRRPATPGWPAGNCRRLRCTPRTSGSAPWPGSSSGPGLRGRWISCAPGHSWTCCWAPTPGPARMAPAARTAPAWAHWRETGSPGRSP